MKVYIKTSLDLDELNYSFSLIKKTYWGNLINKKKFNIQNENSITFGVLKNDSLIGFFRIITDGVFFCYLMDLVIDENYRNQNVGTKVIKEIKKHFPKRKILLLSNNAQNFYLKNNFKLIKESDNYFMHKSNNR